MPTLNDLIAALPDDDTIGGYEILPVHQVRPADRAGIEIDDAGGDQMRITVWGPPDADAPGYWPHPDDRAGWLSADPTRRAEHLVTSTVTVVGEPDDRPRVAAAMRRLVAQADAVRAASARS